jgi:hypothetical protein
MPKYIEKISEHRRTKFKENIEKEELHEPISRVLEGHFLSCRIRNAEL